MRDESMSAMDACMRAGRMRCEGDVGGCGGCGDATDGERALDDPTYLSHSRDTHNHMPVHPHIHGMHI